MSRWIQLTLILSFTLFFSFCGNNQNDAPTDDDSENSEVKRVSRNLDDILEEGVLRGITVYSSTSYFLYRGQTMGYEYEMLQRAADYLNLQLEIVVADDLNEVFDMLDKGEGDVIAAGLTVTKERKEFHNFTEYLYLTKQVLVQKKPKNWRMLKMHEIERALIQDPIELIGDTISVRRNSSFYDRLKHLEDELGGKIYIDTVDGSLSTDKLIDMVYDGEIKYTIADKNIAEIVASYHPDLDVNTPISFSQRTAWAVRKNNQTLTDTLNFWINKFKKYNDYYAIYDRYFKNKRGFKKRLESDYYSPQTGKISEYDELVKKYAEVAGLDWRLMSALIYQESQFNPGAKSWAQAHGLMQLMPATARDLGVNNMMDPEQNLRGGSKYLNQIRKGWQDIPDSIQRIKFIFGSYNCGYYHVKDAQYIAERDGLDPLVWDENVEVSLLNLTYPNYYRSKGVKYGYVRGREPVNYVREIFARFEDYKRFIPD